MAFEIVVVGASTGGLKALQVLLSGLPAEFSLPMVIVQHRGKDLETGSSRLPVTEPEDKESAGRTNTGRRSQHRRLPGNAGRRH